MLGRFGQAIDPTSLVRLITSGWLRIFRPALSVRSLTMRAARPVRCKPIDDHCATARNATPEPDHLVCGDPDRKREQLLDFKFGPREASAIALVRIAEVLTELQREQLSSGQACETSEWKQPVDPAEDRKDGTFAARSRRVSEPTQGARGWSSAARIFSNAPAVP